MITFIVYTVVCFIIAIIILLMIFPSVKVFGDSMLPTLKHGDFLLSTRLFSRKKLKIGDVIVYHPPSNSGSKHEFVIKRVSKIDATKGVYCLGDNPVASFDSRSYGYVPFRNIVTKIVKDKRRKKNGN